MTHKSLLNFPRIFTDPGTDYQINTTITTGISDSQDNDFTIDATDTTNFKQSGYITINSETFYYSSKTATTFNNVYRNINNLSSPQSHSIGATVYQSFTAINKANTTDTKLAGWYIDGYSKQASLRVYDAPVIQSGVIRYVEDASNSANSKFQGCIRLTESGPEWQDFNATQGPQGDAGGVQTVLEFDHVSNNPLTDNITNSGEVIKTSSIDTSSETTIEVRKITEGTRTINFSSQTTVEIETNNDSVIINPKQMPYTEDLTSDTTTLKGSNNKCYGSTQKIYVAVSTTVNKGQVVRYTTSTVDSSTYLTVEPFTFDNDNVAQFTKFNTDNINMAFAGVALETVSSTADTLNEVIICTKGICQIKITDNFEVTAFDHTTTQVNYMGRPCILNTDGYGFNTAEQLAPDTNYLEIGTFLETGIQATLPNSYVLINLNPLFYETA